MASTAADIGIALRRTALSMVPWSTGACNAVCNVNHSETNPLNGGNAEIATHPTRKNPAVHGMR